MHLISIEPLMVLHGKTRQMLPTTNILYKIPVPRLTPTTTAYPTLYTADDTVATTPCPIDVKKILQPLTETDLKVLYYPEFLMDNSKVKALYPAENQDVFTVVAKISCCALALGECFQYADYRSWHMNYAYAMESCDESVFLNMPIFPIVLGPAVGKKTGFQTLGVETENEVYNKLGTALHLVIYFIIIV